MAKTWGKEIWEKKSVHQNEKVVAGGVISILRGRKKYDECRRIAQNEVSDFLKKNKKIKNILEVGPGPDAINAKFFLERGYNLDLVDCSPSTISKVKQRLNNKKVTYYEQDMIDMKINKKYDLIFIFGTFLHCPKHLSMITLNNFNKHLKKGGFLIIDIPLKGKMTLRKGLWEGIYSVGHRIKTKITGKDFYVSCADYTREELDDMFRRTGFKLVQHRSSMWFLEKI